jgi:hypothetical protein
MGKSQMKLFYTVKTDFNQIVSGFIEAVREEHPSWIKAQFLKHPNGWELCKLVEADIKANHPNINVFLIIDIHTVDHGE